MVQFSERFKAELPRKPRRHTSMGVRKHATATQRHCWNNKQRSELPVGRPSQYDQFRVGSRREPR